MKYKCTFLKPEMDATFNLSQNNNNVDVPLHCALYSTNAVVLGILPVRHKSQLRVQLYCIPVL